LRRWGVGLSSDGSDEIRATGKAILLLIDEIERLHVDLWNAKSIAAPPAVVEDEEEEEVPSSDGRLDNTLRARLRRIGSRGSSREVD
jgi:hypothetical protein